MKTMTATLAAFRELGVDRMRRVAQASTQDIVLDMLTPIAQGGNLPVLDGHLINSLVSGLNGTLSAAAGAASKTGDASKAGVALTIAELDAGDVAYFILTAAHALRQNNGFVGEDSMGRTYNQVGHHFVEKATAKWVEAVERNARKLNE